MNLEWEVTQIKARANKIYVLSTNRNIYFVLELKNTKTMLDSLNFVGNGKLNVGI